MLRAPIYLSETYDHGDAETAALVREAGSDCVAVIGAITQKSNTQEAVDALSEAMLELR